MTTRTVSAKGQIELGQDLPAHMGAVPGAHIVAWTMPDGRVLLEVERPKFGISQAFALLKREGQIAGSIERNEAIAKGAADE